MGKSIALATVPKQPAVKHCGHQVGAINRAQKAVSNMPNALTVTGSVKIK
jgi:hypothetical protein